MVNVWLGCKWACPTKVKKKVLKNVTIRDKPGGPITCAILRGEQKGMTLSCADYVIHDFVSKRESVLGHCLA